MRARPVPGVAAAGAEDAAGARAGPGDLGGLEHPAIKTNANAGMKANGTVVAGLRMGSSVAVGRALVKTADRRTPFAL